MIPGTRTALGQVLGINRTPTEADPRLGGFTLTDEGQVIGMSGTEPPASWYPSDLFLNGEQGGLWDFTDLSNLYQDSEGTTPVTAVGDPIGLVLDTKNGTPVLGPELVTNGDGSSTTGWTAYLGGLSVDGGKLIVTNSAEASAQGQQAVTVVAGKTYQVTAEMSGATGSATGHLVIGSSLGGSDYFVGTAQTADKTWSAKITVTGTTLALSLRIATNTIGQTMSWDNISVREIPGNHLTQSTSTKRPVLGRMPATGVRNQLTYTEDFSNAIWAKYGITTSPAAGVSGATTACKMVRTASYAQHRMSIDDAVDTTGGGYYCLSCYAKAAELNYIGLSFYTGDYSKAQFDLTDGSVSQLTANTTATAVNVGNGWWKVSLSANLAGDLLNANDASGFWPNSTDGDFTQFLTGDGVSGVYIDRPQFELGSTATPYQKVVQAYDVTESGVPSVYQAYLDGVDDALVSSSIDFTAMAAMTVFAGFRKLSDAARGTVAELSSNVLTNNGVFALTAPYGASATIGYESKGTSQATTQANVAAPSDSVITAQSSITPAANVLRRNGVEVNSFSGDQGTGNYGNYPLYVGSRGGSSAPYKGFISALCTRGAATGPEEVRAMEEWLAERTPGVTLSGVRNVLPPGWTHANGFTFTDEGKLYVQPVSVGIASWAGGLPFAADGALIVQAAVPPEGTPIVGGVAVDEGGVYIDSATPTFSAFDTGFSGGFS